MENNPHQFEPAHAAEEPGQPKNDQAETSLIEAQPEGGGSNLVQPVDTEHPAQPLVSSNPMPPAVAEHPAPPATSTPKYGAVSSAQEQWKLGETVMTGVTPEQVYQAKKVEEERQAQLAAQQRGNPVEAGWYGAPDPRGDLTPPPGSRSRFADHPGDPENYPPRNPAENYGLPGYGQRPLGGYEPGRYGQPPLGGYGPDGYGAAGYGNPHYPGPYRPPYYPGGENMKLPSLKWPIFWLVTSILAMVVFAPAIFMAGVVTSFGEIMENPAGHRWTDVNTVDTKVKSGALVVSLTSEKNQNWTCDIKLDGQSLKEENDDTLTDMYRDEDDSSLNKQAFVYYVDQPGKMHLECKNSADSKAKINKIEIIDGISYIGLAWGVALSSLVGFAGLIGAIISLIVLISRNRIRRKLLYRSLYPGY